MWDPAEAARDMLLDEPPSVAGFIRRMNEDLQRRRERAAQAKSAKGMGNVEDNRVKWNK